MAPARALLTAALLAAALGAAHPYSARTLSSARSSILQPVRVPATVRHAVSMSAAAMTDDAAALGSMLAARVPELLAHAGKTIVVKYGGHAMTDEGLSQSFYSDVVLLRSLGIDIVIVHGGGPQISAMLKDLNVDSKFVDGRRVTDERTMEVVEMVLGGLVNNKVVNAISRAGGKAVGLTGHAGGGLIGATQMEHWVVDESGAKAKADLGLVGEPTRVDARILDDLITVGAIPVIAPIGVGIDDGSSYNINADTAAGAVASALGAERLLLLTDVAGVLDKSGDLMEALGTDDVERLVEDGTISGGMIPKLETASEAVAGGVGASVILDGRVPHALLLALLPGAGVGTSVSAPEAK